MKRVLSISLGVLLLTSQGSHAQWAVEDLGAIAQRGALWFEEKLQWAQSLKNQADSLVNQYNVIRNQIAAYETFVRNLQRLPQGLNVLDTALAYGHKLTALMQTAGGISYDLNHASQQFAELYIDVGTVTQGDLTRIKQRYLTARMQASHLAVQMQAVQQSSAELFQRLCGLLEGSWTASGNLDSQQIAHQQQALHLLTLQHMQALQATAERLRAQKEAEDVALQRIQMQLMEEFVAPLPAYTGMAGALPQYRWTD